MFFCSDHHFGHSNILTFKDNQGNPIRSFGSIEEHDEYIIAQHNAKVGPKDRVYFLGDVVINKKFLYLVNRLNGLKVLIPGNHDIFGSDAYLKHFEDIRAFKVLPKYGIICCHVPVHPGIFEGRFTCNVHGHLHSNFVLRRPIHGYAPKGIILQETEVDPRYISVCMEKLPDYTPLHLDEILGKLNP